MDTYNTTQVGKLLSVTNRNVLYWCRDGKIKAYQTSPRGLWRIRKEDLLNFLRKHNYPQEIIEQVEQN